VKFVLFVVTNKPEFKTTLTKLMRGDRVKLDDLDTDDSPSENDLTMLNEILKTSAKNPVKYASLKYVFYATALFFVLSLPFTDRIIELAFPMACSWLILIGFKAVAFFVAYYLVSHVSLKK